MEGDEREAAGVLEYLTGVQSTLTGATNSKGKHVIEQEMKANTFRRKCRAHNTTTALGASGKSHTIDKRRRERTC